MFLRFIVSTFYMELTVYNWEIFEKKATRYIWFGGILSIIILLSIFNNNTPWAIILIFLLWWYFYYSSKINKKITIKIIENWLLIWQKVYLWEIINWYVLEADTKNGQIKNIVFLLKKDHHIYTISDDIQNLKNFVEELSKFNIDLIPSYEQTFREKIMRKFQI